VIRHLDSDEICRWAAGERAVDAEQHVAECAACAEAVSRLVGGIAQFRESANSWSDRLRPAPPAAWQPDTPSIRWRALFAGTGLAACLIAALLLVAIPIERGRQRAAAARAADQARSDAMLLEQVDTAVSRSAPASMEPLLKLVNTTGENQ